MLKDLFKDKDKKIGFYSTLIFHLVVLIILLSASISRVMQKENTFVLDFTGYEELEQQLKALQVKEQAQQELEEMLSGRAPAGERAAYRNVAVERSGSELRDDRFENPSQVYDEAAELQRKLDESRRLAEMDQGSDNVSVPGKTLEAENLDSIHSPYFTPDFCLESSVRGNIDFSSILTSAVQDKAKVKRKNAAARNFSKHIVFLLIFFR